MAFFVSFFLEITVCFFFIHAVKKVRDVISHGSEITARSYTRHIFLDETSYNS
jgi:hypothetical protein